jgi:hypothetical protein
MSDKFSSLSGYNYCGLNPIIMIDPDGNEMGDFYDQNKTYLGNDGIDDGKVYQLKEGIQANFKNTKVNWGEKLSEKHSNELKSKSNDLGVAEVKLTFTGNANSKNPKQSDGKLNVIQVALGQEFVRASFDAVGGPWGNGSPENGQYNVGNLLDRGPNSKWPNDGMTKDGIGFSLNVDPLFKTGRSLLRIHPDGGKFFGTQGCIGLLSGKSGLIDFRDLMKSTLSRQSVIPLSIGIVNNPNNNGYGKKVKSNGE